MSEELKGVSADAGSIQNDPTNPNSVAPVGQSNSSGEDYEKQIENLQKVLGTQGKELGENRAFLESISPLLEKLDANPDLVDAIIEDKIDPSLVKAITEGKVSIGDAKTATEAYGNVKKDLGKEKLEKTDPQDLEKLVQNEIAKLRKDIEADKDVKDFQEKIQGFISKTPDFERYAKEIDSWLDKHTDIVDVEVAYYAVKGKLLEDEARKKAEIDGVDYAKQLAMNAAGGNSQGATLPDGRKAVDILISGKSNPNTF
jgi:hypothetical protein